jgi:hypothetical protein
LVKIFKIGGVFMPVIKDVLKEELERLQRMEKAYLNKISQLPKGSVCMKKIAGKIYPYRAFRMGNQVKSEYLKMSQEELELLKSQISQRRKYERVLKSIREDSKFIKAALKKS